MPEFSDDLASVLGEADAARMRLVAAVSVLSDPDLSLARRGGWSIGQVLEHVIESEQQYALGIRALRGETPERRPSLAGPPASVQAALEALEGSRRALHESVAGVDEDTFYRLGRLMHQDYSVLSVIENVTLHDQEHLAQLGKIRDM